MKTRMYVKPVSSELAQLIRKTIEYTAQKYRKRKYIFRENSIISNKRKFSYNAGAPLYKTKPL